MSEGAPTRVEIYEAIDRLERSLMLAIDRGFDGLNQRMDTANGRTTKNEEKIADHSVQLGVLLDRSNHAITQAQTAAVKANTTAQEVSPLKGQIKWVPFASSGALIAIVELIKALLS